MGLLSASFEHEPSTFGLNAILKAQDFNVDLIIRPEELTAREMVRLLEIERAIRLTLGRVSRGGGVECCSKHRSRQEEHSRARCSVQSIPGKWLGGRDIDTYILTVILCCRQIIHLCVAQFKEHSIACEAGRSSGAQKSRVLIVGGGRTGSRVELIESSYKAGCWRGMGKKPKSFIMLKRTECLHGDGSDRSTLIQAGLLNTDTVITTTGDSETNIILLCSQRHLLVQTRAGDRPILASLPTSKELNTSL